MPNEEFEKGRESRQPEIDALKQKAAVLQDYWNKAQRDLAKQQDEISALQAEVEKLRKEHLRLTDLTSYAMKETKPVECCPTCKHEKFHYKAAHIPDCYTPNLRPLWLHLEGGEMKIPEGWKLVPVEPTPEMVSAAFAGKVEDQSLTGQIRRRKAMADDYSAMLAAAQTPPAQSIKPCVEPYKSHQCLDCGQVIETPPAQDDEPVAWTGKGCGVITHKTKTRMIEDAKYGGEFAIAARTAERHDVPLYTRPDTSELRKAADEFIHAYDKHDPIIGAFIENLRAALEKKS